MTPRDQRFGLLPSPLRLFLMLLAVVFLAELASMGLVGMLVPERYTFLGDVAEALVLIVLSGPVLWWLVVRLLRGAAVAEHMQAATVIAHALDGIITINSQGRVEAINPAAERLFGYTAAEVLGQPVTRLIPTRYHDAHRQELERVVRGGESHQLGQTVELVGRRKDGTEFPLELSLAQWQTAKDTFFTGIVRDITERKRAEEEVRLQSAALESAANAIIITDHEGRITWVNPAFSRLTGYTQAEAVNQTPRFLKSGRQDLAFYQDLWATILAGRVWHGEIINRRRDGSLYTEEQTITPVRDARGEISHFVGIKQDITERKRAEEEVRSLARFPSENPNPILRVSADGTLLYANEASQALQQEWGCGPGDPLPQPWAHLVGESLARQTSRTVDIGCGDRTYSFFVAPVPAAGYVNLYGRDVTEQKQAEQTLITRSRQLEAVRAVSAEITRELDLPTLLGLIHRRAAELVGTASGAVLLWDETAQVLVPQAWHGIGDWFKEVRLRLGEGVAGRVAERRVGMIVNDYRSWPHGVALTLEHTGITAILAEPLLYRDRLLGVITINAEGTERSFTKHDRELLALFADQASIAIENARLYEEIRQNAATLGDRVKERTAELEEALRVKAQFLANMSHELRTPLNAVLGFSEVLLGRGAGDLAPKQERYLRQIHEGGKRLLGLVTDLLEMTRTETGPDAFRVVRLAVSELVTEVLTPLAVAAQARQVEMVPALDPGLPTVVADRGKLAQILHHLLTNAIRFTPAGGRVTVRTRRIGTREGEEAEIAVEDTGIGIRAEDRERIFRGFEQVDTSDTRQYGGAGLGLTLVRRLVELHGGRVWAESGGEGQGARFIVRLPLLTAPLPRRVLIVEDEALLRREMAETLGAAGFAVGEAATGAEALAALAGPPPDLLILDIVLPDLDGWEVLAQVRREGRTRGLPVLIITGLESIRADQALALGADEFLAKPVSAQVLVDTVGRLLRQAAAH